MRPTLTKRGKPGPDAIFDVAVIGGGPAGMMAAGRAAELGARVVLLEKNAKLGKKLLITGGGRSNVTNAEFDTRKFLAKFRKNDQFLFSAFSQFAVRDAIDFFEQRGMKTKVEAEQRVFPVSDSAESVWKVLVEYMKQGHVTVLRDTPAMGFAVKEGAIQAVKVKGGGAIFARTFVLATGGKSHPETGSTGEGFDWLTALGHKVIDQSSALVPVAVKDAWVKRLSGVGLSGVKLTLFQNDVAQGAQKGKMLLTHFGISGPLALNSSRDIGELLKYGEVTLSLDLFPSEDHGALDQRLRDTLAAARNKKFKNSLAGFLSSALAAALVERSGIPGDLPANSVSRDARIAFVKLLKDLRMEASHLLGLEKAVVTSGGVDLKEVDFKTMRSRLYPNLYFAGDVLNIDRPSGGYSLQLAWTTGHVAGSAASKITE